MKKRWVLLMCISLSPDAWGQASDNPTGYVPSGYEISFQDEFTSLRLDPKAQGTGWQTYFPWTKKCPGFNVRRFPDNQDQQLWVDPDYGVKGERLGIPVHRLTEQGTLQLLAKRTPPNRLRLTEGMPYVGGAITTQCTFWQQFGYFESRIRFSFGKGQHWAFWMLPKDHTHGGIEIDIVERVGRKGELDRIYQNSHGEPTDISFVKVTGDPGDWVTYGLEWTDKEITWFVDGKPTRKIENYIWEPMYLILCCEVGNSWPGNPDETTPWPSVAEIDYVRAYQKKPD